MLHDCEVFLCVVLHKSLRVLTSFFMSGLQKLGFISLQGCSDEALDLWTAGQLSVACEIMLMMLPSLKCVDIIAIA